MTSSEVEQIRLARGGDAEAFRALYQAHVGRIFAICLRLSGDRGQAEELTQDVFVQVWRQLGSFRGESSFGTWLHRVAVNEVLSQFRSRSRRMRHETAEDLDQYDPPARSSGPPPIDLDQAIARLPPGARQVFVLHDVEGFQHAEIAGLAGIAIGTSKAQLHRARRLLKESLNR
ncbi:MAG: RNA polymerase sigma factor [Gemmatimonadota bacterium]